MKPLTVSYSVNSSLKCSLNTRTPSAVKACTLLELLQFRESYLEDTEKYFSTFRVVRDGNEELLPVTC